MSESDERSDLAELYQETVLDHGRQPRNQRAIEEPDRVAAGYNPMCGDQVTVYLSLEGDVITDVSFMGTACAICTASCSMMTRALKGKTEAEARELFGAFHYLLTHDDPGEDAGVLGSLEALAGVRRFPIRVKCATLPWHAMKAALDRAQEPTSTE